MFERFTAVARTTVMTHAPAEARYRGDRRIGTEHLLLGVLHDPETARALGTDLDSARAALAALDEAALAVVGVDARGVDARGVDRGTVAASSKRVPFTSGARTALSRALAVARRTRARRVTASHLMLALLDGDSTDPATEVLTRLGLDRTAARARLTAQPSRRRA